jgi:hypothetical protein
MVIADCYVVRDALEAFAAENGGVYPVGPVDALLPGGQPLVNHYTGIRTGPVLYDSQWPGEIGVILYSEYAGLGASPPPTGYRVVGRGRYGELIRIENFSAISQSTIGAYDSVLANCDLVVAAAEEFARRNGQYPSDVGADGWRTGAVMTSLLPGGEMLTNPFYGVQDSPVDGAAAGPGQIGYQPFDYDGDGRRDGYLIDALGADGVTVVATRTLNSPEDEHARSAAFRLRSAVEEFASENGGEYPRDVDTDTTPSGNTLRDLVPNYSNLYTGGPAAQDGLANSRGEVGYVPVENNGIVTGYVINALGLFNEELERFEVLTN